MKKRWLQKLSKWSWVLTCFCAQCTFIPGRIYLFDLKEQSQVLLQFVGTFLRSIISFVSTTFCAIGLLSSPVAVLYHYMKRFGSYLGLWETELFSIPLLLCFFLACLHLLAVPQNKDNLSVYLQRAQFCLRLVLWLHSHICPQPAEYPAVCLVLLLLPAEKSGLGLEPVPGCVCWVVSTTFCLYIPACTQTMCITEHV